MGERRKDALRVTFDRKVKLEFHGTKVTSDAGWAAMVTTAVGRKCLKPMSFMVVQIDIVFGERLTCKTIGQMGNPSYLRYLCS